MGNAADNADFSALCQRNSKGDPDEDNKPLWAIAHALMELAQAQHAANALTMEQIINNSHRYHPT